MDAIFCVKRTVTGLDNMGPFIDLGQIAVFIHGADTARDMSFICQRVLQQVGNHHETLLFIVLQGNQRVVGQSEGLRTLIIV